ncbi:hypothetical protein HHK36_010944 [Tetracentron sinense]|uniref:C3H1-type domain-containing protein n=1 Tax=Tetracentron sinense TaxID=13715 RepID=A0A835DGS6_TETSI|nr:hypothetical protein HHK36_010944 [Tetracentron sinense]
MMHYKLRDTGECSDTPISCGSCLGGNPYVRMIKGVYGKECKTCTRPYTVFRWKPSREARYKSTQICKTCSKLKNVCQVCILDLQYGLPVEVRDTMLSINSSSSDSIPRSNPNREYLAEEHDRKARSSGVEYYDESYYYLKPRPRILKFQRSAPYYERNQPRICSFYTRGECTRGAECPYRHEMPITGDLSQQNIQDRYHGVNDPVALKILNKAGESAGSSGP